MPASITEEKLIELAQSKKASTLRIFRIKSGQHKGHMKLKLRTPKRLYTLTMKNAVKAKEITKQCSNYVEIVRINKKK